MENVENTEVISWMEAKGYLTDEKNKYFYKLKTSSSAELITFDGAESQYKTFQIRQEIEKSEKALKDKYSTIYPNISDFTVQTSYSKADYDCCVICLVEKSTDTCLYTFGGYEGVFSVEISETGEIIPSEGIKLKP